MTNDHKVGFLMLAIALTFIVVACVKHIGSTFTLNGTEYAAVGVMEIHDDGKTVYVPVFKRN